MAVKDTKILSKVRCFREAYDNTVQCVLVGALEKASLPKVRTLFCYDLLKGVYINPLCVLGFWFAEKDMAVSSKVYWL